MSLSIAGTQPSAVALQQPRLAMPPRPRSADCDDLPSATAVLLVVGALEVLGVAALEPDLAHGVEASHVEQSARWPRRGPPL